MLVVVGSDPDPAARGPIEVEPLAAKFDSKALFLN